MLRMLQNRQSDGRIEQEGEPIPLDALQPQERMMPRVVVPQPAEEVFDGGDLFGRDMFGDMDRAFGNMERGFGNMLRGPPLEGGWVQAGHGSPSHISESSSSMESHETYVNDGQHKPLHTATMVGSSQELHGDDPKHLSGDAAAVKCKNGKCVSVHALLKPKAQEA